VPSQGVEASPFLWTALAALCAGLAAGQALGVVRSYLMRFRARGGAPRPSPEAGPGSGRLARAGAFASLGILAFAALLVLPPKASFAAPALCAWAAALGAAGLAAGLWPRAGTAAALALFAASALILRILASPYSPYADGSEIARLLPLSVTAGQAAPIYRGELRLFERGAAETRLVELPLPEASIVAETIELRGPLAFLSLFPASGSIDRRLYRVVGIAGGAAAPYLLPRPRGLAEALLSRIAPLGPGPGFVSGEPPARAEAAAGLLVRSRAASAAPPDLQPFQSVVYTLGGDGIPRIAPLPGGGVLPVGR